MAVATVADDVENDVFVKLLAKVESELDDGGSGEGVIAVDVKDRESKGFAWRSAITAGAGVIWKSGKGDLVIDDDVDRTPGSIAFEAGEIQSFCNDSLADEGPVPVNKDWHNLFPLYRVVPMALAGAGFAFYDRIYGF